jgi:hypothetical protein
MNLKWHELASCAVCVVRLTTPSALGVPAIPHGDLLDPVIPLRSIPFTAKAVNCTEFPASSIRSTTLLPNASKVILVRAPVKKSHGRTNRYTNVKIMFFYAHCVITRTFYVYGSLYRCSILITVQSDAT